jgi:hypothetical protein
VKQVEFFVQGRPVHVIVNDDGTVYLAFRVSIEADPSDNTFLVKGEAGQEYVVGPTGACTCPAGQHQKPCKHQRFVQEIKR